MAKIRSRFWYHASTIAVFGLSFCGISYALCSSLNSTTANVRAAMKSAPRSVLKMNRVQVEMGPISARVIQPKIQIVFDDGEG